MIRVTVTWSERGAWEATASWAGRIVRVVSGDPVRDVLAAALEGFKPSVDSQWQVIQGAKVAASGRSARAVVEGGEA